MVEAAGVSRSSRLQARIRSQARRVRREFPVRPASRRFASRCLRSPQKNTALAGGIFLRWWWGRTRFQIRAYRGLLVPMVRPRIAAESYRQLSLPRPCPQLSGVFRSFLADQFMAVFRLLAGDPAMSKSPDRWVFHKVGDSHKCYRKPEEVLSGLMNHPVG